MAIEEPEYAVLESSGPLELRSYNSVIVAETLVSGSMDEASSAGFRLISDLSLIHISEPTRLNSTSRIPSSA